MQFPMGIEGFNCQNDFQIHVATLINPCKKFDQSNLNKIQQKHWLNEWQTMFGQIKLHYLFGRVSLKETL